MFDYPKNPKESARLLRLLRNVVLAIGHGLVGVPKQEASGVAAKFDQLAKDVEAGRITVSLLDTEVTRALLRLSAADLIGVLAGVEL